MIAELAFDAARTGAHAIIFLSSPFFTVHVGAGW